MAQAQSSNVTTVINESRVSVYRWAVLAMSRPTAMFDGYDTQGIAYVAPSSSTAPARSSPSARSCSSR